MSIHIQVLLINASRRMMATSGSGKVVKGVVQLVHGRACAPRGVSVMHRKGVIAHAPMGSKKTRMRSTWSASQLMESWVQWGGTGKGATGQGGAGDRARK